LDYDRLKVTARIAETLLWLGYRLQETEESGFDYRRNGAIRHRAENGCGNKAALIKRVRGFIPRWGGEVLRHSYQAGYPLTPQQSVSKNETSLVMHAQRDNSGTVSLLLLTEF
jgi:hypothetical protein